MISTNKPLALVQIGFFAVFGLAATFAATGCDVGPIDSIDEIAQQTEHSTAQDPPCNHKNPSKKNSGQCPKPPGQKGR